MHFSILLFAGEFFVASKCVILGKGSFKKCAPSPRFRQRFRLRFHLRSACATAPAACCPACEPARKLANSHPK